MLTPFYDLMCTRLYPGMSPDFAFAIGGEYRPASLTREHLTVLARELGMRPQFLAQLAADLARTLPFAVDRAITEVEAALPHPARTLVHRFARFVRSTTKKLAGRLAG